jgi:hypothetical protein
MMHKIILGVDPGAQGAIAILELNKKSRVIPFKKYSWGVVAQVLHEHTKEFPLYYAYVEAVAALPKDGAHNAFTFGENTGIIKGILIANGIIFTEVHSQKWQRHFGLGAKYPSKTARKNAQKAKAQELFPDIKVTLDIADALLIAKYGYDISRS